MFVIRITNILEIWVKFVNHCYDDVDTHPIVDDVNLRGDDDLDLGHQSNQLIEKLGDQQP